MGSHPEQVFRLRGIVYGGSEYTAPDGSMHITSQNLVIREADRLESRRGLRRALHALRYDKIIEYQQSILTHVKASGSMHRVDAPFTSVARLVGVAGNPATRRIQHAVAGNRLFVTSATGLKVLDDVSTGVLRDAGGPVGLSLSADLTSAGTTVFANKRVAYRYTLGRVTSSGIQIIGAPSAYTIAENLSGITVNPILRLRLPDGCDESFFMQLWRSSQASGVSPIVNPEDDLRLVYERPLTQAEVVQKYADITDQTPDALRGEYLYTSPNAGEGILQANHQPPIGEEVVLHKNRLWLGRTSTRQEFNFTILAVGAPNGLQANDRIVIGGPVTPIELRAGIDFAVTTSGSASQNVEKTALAFVDAVNTAGIGSNTSIYAEYLSGPDSTPGEIRLFSRLPAGTQFTLSLDMQTGSAAWSARSAYAPQLTPLISGPAGTRTFSLTRLAGVVTATVSAGAIAGMLSVGERIIFPGISGVLFGAGPHIVTGCVGSTFTYAEAGANVTQAGVTCQFYADDFAASTNEVFVNRIYWSKPDEYEAWPTQNYTDIGATDKGIIAMRVTRETLWVFKEDGLFRLTGDDEDTFDVERMDATVIAITPECVVPFAESVVAWTTKGIVMISESNFDVISTDIDAFLRYYLSCKDALTTSGVSFDDAFMVADDREGLLRLHLPGGSYDDVGIAGAGEALVYCVATQAWGRWVWIGGASKPKPLTFGLVHSIERQVIYCDGYYPIGGEGFLWTEAPFNNEGAAAAMYDDDERLPSPTQNGIQRKAIWQFQHGHAPLLDKRFDELAVLFPTAPTPFLYMIKPTSDMSTILFGVYDAPDFVLDRTATVGASPVVRFGAPNIAKRGQRIYMGVYNDIISETFTLNGFLVAYEVLNGSISR
jgi:hypothetical protein